MFTGLIQEIGTIEAVRPVPEGRRIRIRGPQTVSRLAEGDSVAVSGACLTVSSLPDGASFEAVAVGETLRRTTLGQAAAGARVHLEPALRLGDPLGGHWVQGHVDGTVRLLEIRSAGSDLSFSFELPAELEAGLVEKGSVALDGVSLTVSGIGPGSFRVAVIPETRGRTLFGSYRPGARVNLEADILGKYVQRILQARMAGTSAAWSMLEKWNEDGDHGRDA